MHPLPESVAFSEDHHALIGSEEFPWETVFSDLDEPLKAIREARPLARQEAAELFRELMTWCFSGNRSLRTALVKFVAIVSGIRPELLADRNGKSLSEELHVSKQALSHQAVAFENAWNVKFSRCRSKEAREHMRKARLGGRNHNLGKQKAHDEAITTHPTA